MPDFSIKIVPANPNKIFPPLPKGSSLPFYYASVNAIWVYYKIPWIGGIVFDASTD